MHRLAPAIAIPLLLAACHPGDGAAMPGDREDTRPYGEIAPEETLRFTGTEPFWGGEVKGATLLYKTPETPDGEKLAVSRFAGRGGLSWSGTLAGKAFTMAATPGACSDGMSERTYPFVVTLQIGEETRSGCGWSDRHPFKGPQAP